MATDETNDQTFMMTFSAVLAVLLILTILVFVTATAYSGGNDDKVSDVERNRIAGAIHPYGQVAVGSPPPEAAPATPKLPLTGVQVIAENCAGCHESGSLGAPKIGDKADWGARLAKVGADALVANAINGIRGMPARGNDDELTDNEVKNALIEMLKQSGGLELK